MAISSRRLWEQPRPKSFQRLDNDRGRRRIVGERGRRWPRRECSGARSHGRGAGQRPGNLYIVDWAVRVREVSNGIITTLAGSLPTDCTCAVFPSSVAVDGGPAMAAELGAP